MVVRKEAKATISLSHETSPSAQGMGTSNEALEKAEIVKGYVKARTKAGMIVTYSELRHSYPVLKSM